MNRNNIFLNNKHNIIIQKNVPLQQQQQSIQSMQSKQPANDNHVFSITKIKTIDLFSTKFVENIINALAKILEDCGIKVNVFIRNITNEDIIKCIKDAEHFMFICCPQTLLQCINGPVYPATLIKLPPNKYFLYQLEQLDIYNPKFLNPYIASLIVNSRHTFDYSDINLKYYPVDFKEKVSKLTPPIVESPFVLNNSINGNLITDKPIDVLFCGHINERRHIIIQFLQTYGINVTVKTNVFGKELTKLISQSKIFLNIHNNNSSDVLETCRLHEALMSASTHIVSEPVKNTAQMELYKDRVIFTDELLNTIKCLLTTYTEYNSCWFNYHKIKHLTESELFNALHIEYENPKVMHRHNCYGNLQLIKNVIIPDIAVGCKNETVLIEFRPMPHLEFLLRNTVIKFPHWSHTVVCGNANYSFIKSMCDTISQYITIIHLDIDNLFPSDYSKLLMTAAFWLNFKGEKILLYQEDTALFHNRIDEFMNYDYIGASWPKEQNDNSQGVGNGGFSLRTKAKMIECIEKVNPYTDLELGKSTVNYMKDTNSYHLPEDVYFSKTLIDYKLGVVARRDVANKFSQETQLCSNPLGGHNFWLAKGNKLNVGMKCDKLGIYSPYDYIVGGGESYISNIISFFIKNGTKEVIFLSNTSDDVYKKTLEFYFTDSERQLITKIHPLHIPEYRDKFDFFIHMSNSKETNINFRLGKKQLFHCQFPFDLHGSWKSNFSLRHNYDAVVLNSEFTLEHYKKCSKNMFPLEKIHILYPHCYKKTNDKPISEKNNINKININNPTDKVIFVSIGRIFTYNKMANNKHHDKIIKVFNRIHQTHTNYELHIIGTVQSANWCDYLNNIANENIFIHPNLKDENKTKYLQEANYIIHAAGMDDNEMTNPFVFEHFGISVIEGLENKCIPICTDGGFPKHYIKHEENGYLFKDGNDLYRIIDNILGKKTTLQLDKAIEINNAIVARFTYEKYCSSLASVLLNM